MTDDQTKLLVTPFLGLHQFPIDAWLGVEASDDEAMMRLLAICENFECLTATFPVLNEKMGVLTFGQGFQELRREHLLD
jgi:hypothetical protein